MKEQNKLAKTILKQLEFFIVFSFLGWIYESIWCSIIDQNVGFVNRGVLFGPWLPIYGTGMILIFFFLEKFKVKNGFLVFLTGTGIATIVELIGSYIMEIVVGSIAWNYSDMFGNFQGRIAVEPDMMFGFLTLIAFFGVLPYLKKYQEGNQKIRYIIDTVVICLFLLDCVLFVIKR